MAAKMANSLPLRCLAAIETHEWSIAAGFQERSDEAVAPISPAFRLNVSFTP